MDEALTGDEAGEIIAIGRSMRSKRKDAVETAAEKESDGDRREEEVERQRRR